jgi:hypothetical protein
VHAGRAAARGAAREPQKHFSVYLEAPVYDQLRGLAYAEQTRIHALVREAIDLLFHARGARSIGELEAGTEIH